MLHCTASYYQLLPSSVNISSIFFNSFINSNIYKNRLLDRGGWRVFFPQNSTEIVGTRVFSMENKGDAILKFIRLNFKLGKCNFTWDFPRFLELIAEPNKATRLETVQNEGDGWLVSRFVFRSCQCWWLQLKLQPISPTYWSLLEVASSHLKLAGYPTIRTKQPIIHIHQERYVMVTLYDTWDLWLNLLPESVPIYVRNKHT